MVIEAMDGRKRGQYLRDDKGRFTTRTQWSNNVQGEIDKYYQDIARRKKFMDQNPDLKVLNDADMAKIQDLEKERRLVNNSQRGINDRVKIYREAMEKQGLKGQQLDEQVARYREGLLAERRKHFDKLKGKNIARGKANEKLKVQPKEAGKLKKFLTSKGLKKAGKWGAIAALVVGVGFGIAALVKGCSNDKKSEEVKPEETTAPVEETPVEEDPAVPVAPEEPAQPEEPAYEPIVKLNDDGTYTTKKNDNFYKLAENLLKDYCAQNKIDKTITAESPEVQILAERIMKKNEYWYNPNCTEAHKRYSAPMLYPNITLNMVEFSDLLKKAEEVQEEEKAAA